MHDNLHSSFLLNAQGDRLPQGVGGSRTFPYLLALRGVFLCNYLAIFVSICCVNDGSSFQGYAEPSQWKYDTIEIALPSDLLCRVVCSKNKPPFLFPIHVIHLVYPLGMFSRMLPMEKSDLNESPSRIKCERGPDKKTECRNYCACGIMSKCTAGSSWREHCECKFSRKSSSGDRCMYYRDTINGHCDCVNAQRELKYTNNR